MYQLLGGFLPYDPEYYLSPAQKKLYKKLSSDFEKSKFIDDILCKLASKGKLLDYSTLPYYVDKSIKRIITKATDPDPGKRYGSASLFMLKLHQLGILPDWWKIDHHYTLMNYDGKDFRIVPGKNYRLYKCMKSKTNQENWRRESFGEDTQKSIVEKLMKKICQV